MILIELIFPERNKRLFLTTEESISVGEFEEFLNDFFELKNSRILIMTGRTVSGEMSLFEAGVHTGTGVMICEHFDG